MRPRFCYGYEKKRVVSFAKPLPERLHGVKVKVSITSPISLVIVLHMRPPKYHNLFQEQNTDKAICPHPVHQSVPCVLRAVFLYSDKLPKPR
jgi:hypothetical protein